MQLTLRIIVVIIIALLVVAAVFGAASGIISQIGDTVTDTGDEQTGTLDCVINEGADKDAKDCSQTSIKIETLRGYKA